MMEGNREAVICEHCDAPAMVNRLPRQTTTQFIHLHCWPCARAFYWGPPKEIVKAALVAFWDQLGETRE